MLLSTTAAKTVEGLSVDMGAEVTRYTYSVDATAGDNSDGVVVVINPLSLFGIPGIRLRATDKIGFKLNDNFSSGYVISGTAFGRKIYLDT